MRLSFAFTQINTIMAYKRSDMLYTYSWEHTQEDDPKLRGEPDSSMFNRREGYEVLYLINKFLTKKNKQTTAAGNTAERAIHNELPSHVRSQENVMTWLNTNVSL